jgi:putative transposase
MAFIDTHRERFGIEPICAVLRERDCGIAPSTYYAAKARLPSARVVRDELVLEHVRRVHASPTIGRGLYGARKVWHELAHEQARGEHLELGAVPRCQVERLMAANGLRGVRRDKTFVTTRRDAAAKRPPDLVKRNFRASRPNELWVVDFERHEAFANPGGGGRPPSDACRSRRLKAGGRSAASAWGWLVEQSSTTTSRSSTARWGGLG